MKVGILTFHRVPNVGAYLQCSSLCNVVRALGHDAEVIDYVPIAQRQMVQPKFAAFLGGVCRSPRRLVGGWRAFCNARVRYNAAQRDIARLNLGAKVSDAKGLSRLKYDRYVLGSDEIWNVQNPLMGQDLAYAGAYFANEFLCSYAPSCGSVERLEDLPPGMALALRRIRHASARDKNTGDILARCGVVSALVVDPTLLGARVGMNALPVVSDEVIIYGHPLPRQTLAAVEELAARNRWKLRSIIFPQHVKIPHQSGVDSKEFLKLLGSAQAIVTTTYHGTIFSMLAGRPFAVVSPGKKVNKISDLLQLVGATDRMVTDVTRLEGVLKTPLSSAKLDEQIGKATTRSLEFLQHALA